jgi:hypothetical protein
MDEIVEITKFAFSPYLKGITTTLGSEQLRITTGEQH